MTQEENIQHALQQYHIAQIRSEEAMGSKEWGNLDMGAALWWARLVHACGSKEEARARYKKHRESVHRESAE